MQIAWHERGARMIDFVRWVESVEKQAADIYAKAAEKWPDDEPLSAFLNKLHEDELTHADMMQRIAQLIQTEQTPTRSDIKLTPETKAQVEEPLREILSRLTAGEVTRKELWEAVARIEFGEWNDVFLYVVALFKERSPDLERLAAGMQAHIARIEHFLHDLPADERPALDVATLAKVWPGKFLVVEDNPVVREFIVNLLMRKGTAYAAANGKEGLELTRRHFFNVIVTDIEMPVMNGIRFYEEAVAEDPRWKGHFLFMTFNLAPDRAQFLKEESAPCVLKPFDPRELVALVEVVARTSADAM